MFGKKKNQKPEELHGYLSRLIADEMEKAPASSDHWVKYMVVQRPHEDDMETIDVRIYDKYSAEQKKIRVTDFASLDSTPDLILFEGWYNKKKKQSDIKFKKAA